MNWQTLKKEGVTALQKAGIDNASYDAGELLYEVSGFNMSTYPLHMREEAPEDVRKRYLKLVDRRAGHEPLQYILGKAWLFGQEFYVEPGVLIPRYDTETLIEAALPCLKETSSVLDLCCGSGCILTALLTNGPSGTYGTGADLSDTALRVTSRNLKKYGLEGRTRVVKSDLFSGLSETYDIIVSNPPYIPDGEIPYLESEVRDFEPRLALAGGRDGLDFYRKIAAEASAFLNPDGILAMEIGFDEGQAVSQIMKEHGFRNVSLFQDLAGKDRVVLGYRGDGKEKTAGNGRTA